MGKVLITGATGFVGQGLCAELQKRELPYRAALRTATHTPNQDHVVVGHIDASTNWQTALVGIDTIIHLAARVHVMQETAADPLTEFRAANVDATVNLAKQAAQTGVKRFIFVSSIKVNGEETFSQPFTALDIPAPLDPYGQSKLEAETGLHALAQKTGLEIVIVRPPLVYGPNVRANFYRLMQLVQLGLPMPLGKINNHRSMVALDNLVDLLLTCGHHPAAVGQTFLVSDDDDVSLSRLLQLIAKAMGKRIYLLPAPITLIQLLAKLTGKTAVVNRLLGSLQVDISHTKNTLGWQPVISVEQALDKTVQYFLAQR